MIGVPGDCDRSHFVVVNVNYFIYALLVILLILKKNNRGKNEGPNGKKQKNI